MALPLPGDASCCRNGLEGAPVRASLPRRKAADPRTGQFRDSARVSGINTAAIGLLPGGRKNRDGVPLNFASATVWRVHVADRWRSLRQGRGESVDDETACRADWRALRIDLTGGREAT